MASDFALRLAVHQIRRGGVIIYPTETVYGLGCDPLNYPAVDYLNTLKQRNTRNGLILLAADFEQLHAYVDLSSPLDWSKLQKTTQATSWIVPANPDLPYWITAPEGTVAVRITSHPVARQLCKILGHPLVSSSVNPSGAKPATNALQIVRYFHNMVHCVVLSNQPTSGKPSIVKRLLDDVAMRN